jgi:acetyl-CoA carboxylase carboxyl transferase subunit beta
MLFSKPKYSMVQIKKKDIPIGLWTKCPITGEMVYNRELEQNLMVVPKSEYHFSLDAYSRINSLIDEGTFQEHDVGMTSVDPLNFKGVSAYTAKIEEYICKTGLSDAVVCGVGDLDGIKVSLSVMDFRFLGASMGSVVGEKITRAIERGIELSLPVIIVCASGGARMYEGIFSLMQMAKTSAALAKLSEADLPYIAVLTNPTMAGVMASFASLGDLIVAEPGAVIGFAGRRVIKEGTQQDLPEGFQTAEFLLEHGLIDQVIHRKDMKRRLGVFLKMFCRVAA